MAIVAVMAGAGLRWARQQAQVGWSSPLARVGLRLSDLASNGDYISRDQEHGDMHNRDSLEWCDQDITSERHRVDRWASTAHNPEGSGDWTTVVTRYDSVASAELAMEEARAVTCPVYAVPDYYVAGDAMRAWLIIPLRGVSVPPADRLDRFTSEIILSDSEENDTAGWTDVLLRRGRVVVDLSGPHQPTPTTTPNPELDPSLPPPVTGPAVDVAVLGTQYLAAANRVNAAMRSFWRAEPELGKHPTKVQVDATATPYVRAEAAFDDAVAGLAVGAGEVYDRDRLLQAGQRSRRDLAAYGAPGMPDLTSWSDQVTSDEDMDNGAANQLRMDLRLPHQ